MEKEKYIRPEVEVVSLEEEIIMTSGDDCGGSVCSECGGDSN